MYIYIRKYVFDIFYVKIRMCYTWIRFHHPIKSSQKSISNFQNFVKEFVSEFCENSEQNSCSINKIQYECFNNLR